MKIFTQNLLFAVKSKKPIWAIGYRSAGLSLGLSIVMLLCSTSSWSQFTAGRLVVLRDGATGLGAAPSSAGTAMFLAEYSTTGAAGITIALPTSTTGSINRIVGSGSATSEGQLNLSTDGRYLLTGGYDAATGLASVNSAAVNRVIARVDNAGNVATTLFSSTLHGSGFRSVASVDGSQYWTGGNGGGIGTIAHVGGLTPGATTIVSNMVTNNRSVSIYNNQLYFSTGSGTTAIYKVGTGVPTNTGNTSANIFTAVDPYAFYMVNRGVNLWNAYVAYASSPGIYKWSSSDNGATWTSRGSITTASLYGITGTIAGGSPVLYATTTTSIITLTDGAAYNANISGTATTLVTAPTNTFFRGIAFAPVSTTPTITGAATASAFTTAYGTASAVQNFTVSAVNLTANLIANAPSGFEVSSDGSTYSTTATFTQSGGNVSGTLRLRLAATAPVGGSYNSKNITLTSSGATTVNITTASSGNAVAAKGLTITGISADNKVYDGNPNATISGTPAYSGLVNSESFSVSGAAVAVFSGSDAGMNIVVNVSGYTAPSPNYTITQPVLSANIGQAPLTISSAAASTKIYDATANAVITGTLNGVIGSEDVSFNGTGTFAQSTVGTNINVTSTSTLSGAQSANYTLIQPTGLQADIQLKSLTISGIVANNKTFDGNTNATLSGTASLSGVIATDVSNVILGGTITANFTQSAVGNNIPVIVSGYTISGSASGNYSLTQPSGLTANITASPTPVITSTLTASATYNVPAATYTITATNSPTSFNASGLPLGLNLNTSSGQITGTPFADPGTYNVSISATNNGGTGTPVTLVYTILPKALTVSGSADDKVYDRNNAGTITGTLNGAVITDDVNLSGTGTFAQVTVGTLIPVTSTSTLTGTDAFKYTLTQPTGLYANITQAEITITGATASDKAYDGNTNAVVTGSINNGVISPDNVSVSGNGNFISVQVGNNIQVNTSLVLSGADAFNYSITQPVGLTANIQPVGLTVSGVVAVNKVYDGTTTATLSGTPVLNGVIGSDDVSVSGTPVTNFNNKNAGNSKPVTVSGYTLTGADAGNYFIIQPSGLTANITQAPLTISGAAAQDKLFDGNTNAVITGTLNEIISPDVVSLVGTGQFASSAVGNNIAVTSTSTLSGADAANYIIDPQPSGLTANILPAPVTLAIWTYEPLQGATATPTPNTGSGSSSLVGSMTGPGTATGMNGTGCGAQVSGQTAWAIATAAPGSTNESSGAQFNTSTVGYNGIKFSWDQRSSNTSPNTMRLQYTTNGTAWTNFTMTSANTTFCLGTLNNGRFENSAVGDQFRRVTVDLSSISGINNNANFGVRVVASYYQGTTQFRQTLTPASVATAGTWRFDNVLFTGYTLPAGPTSSVISGNAIICENSSANINVSITGGTSPYTIVYTDGSNNFSVSNYSSGALIPVNPVITTNYTLLSVTDASNMIGSGNTGTSTITVNPLPTVSYGTLAPTYCTTNGAVTLTSNQASGTFTISGTPPAGTLVDNGNGTATFNPATAGAGTYTITFSYTNGNGCTATDAHSTTVSVCATFTTLNVKAVLEGFYDGTLTSPAIMRANIFDLGISTDPTEADSITVNLWRDDHTNPETYLVPDYSVITVLHTDGNATMQFPAAVSGGSYYIAIKHRNSIETWSKLPITFTATTAYDFTTGLSKAYDDGNNPPMKLMATGVYGLYGGDINQDGGIDGTDMNFIDNEIGGYGYNISDVNGDGGTDGQDMNYIDNNTQLNLFYARPY